MPDTDLVGDDSRGARWHPHRPAPSQHARDRHACRTWGTCRAPIGVCWTRGRSVFAGSAQIGGSVCRCEWRCMSCQSSACRRALRLVPSGRKPALSATPHDSRLRTECWISIRWRPASACAQRTSVRRARVATDLPRAEAAPSRRSLRVLPTGSGKRVMRPKTLANEALRRPCRRGHRHRPL